MTDLHNIPHRTVRRPNVNNWICTRTDYVKSDHTDIRATFRKFQQKVTPLKRIKNGIGQ
jgi:hypothetical protein